MSEEEKKLNKVTDIFHILFKQKYKTILFRGNDQPFYQAAGKETIYNKIIYANNSLSSAFHEISHWMIAGSKRRELDDYGYWYKPDGRNDAEQCKFFEVEVKPQALEWIFSTAAKHPFNFSVDNLGNNDLTGVVSFKKKVIEQVYFYLNEGFPLRADLFVKNLTEKFNNSKNLKKKQFILC